MLSANPIVLGTVYIEEDLGSDLHGDRFELTFAGGAGDTQLTRLVIRGDQNTPGFGTGDVLFDTESGGLGADHWAGFRVEQLISSDPEARVAAHVVDGQSELILDFHGFRAGDKLVFSIDVDEIEYFDPTETDTELINEGFDPITSGVEFQGSQMVAFFTAPHYKPAEGNSIFWNRYDDALTASGLDLPADNIDGKRDRTTGAFTNLQQVVDPASISGYVYADDSNDGLRDSGERGLAAVTVEITPIDTIETQQTVTVSTDENGYYEADNLSPGTYRVVEVVQPSGYLDGLDAAGTVNGGRRGTAVNPGDTIEDIFLAGGTHGVEYNFGEILPASIEGSVHLSDREGNCCSSGIVCEPLAGVTIHLLDEAGSVVAHTATDARGDYEFSGLVPGTYSVVEFTPAGLIDASAQAGKVGETVRGEVIDPNTVINIALRPGDHGRDYDFCEHLPSSVSGFVYHDGNDNGLREAGEEAIAGVQINLFDRDDSPLGMTRTDVNGYYEFEGLPAGTYRIVESQPSDWLDGKEAVGHVDGVGSGTVSANDTLGGVTLLWGSRGVEYNFGELLPGTLQGVIHADLDRDCIFDPIETPISHVKIELLDADGAVLATTLSDNRGEYSFVGLTPGTYAVRETQPNGYFHGSQTAGSHGGNDSDDDLISHIPVGSGQHLVHYDFCEVVPGSISGTVYVDPNQNEIFDVGERQLKGVTVQLLDGTGRVVATTETNEVGYYEFVNLRPSTYGVQEFQPEGYFHGGQQAGSHGGDDSSRDLITSIVIGAGEHLTDYNFSELPPSSIQGTVYVSPGGTCSISPETPIRGVTIELLDANGQVVGTTRTDARGHYLFDGLRPGEYALAETQPQGFFQGGQCAGTGGGNALHVDLVTEIQIGAGEDLRHYDFYEIPPASLSGYVFQDGPAIQTADGSAPENLADIRDGLRTPDDKPIAGVKIELRNGLTGEPITADEALEGMYPEGPIVAVTDAQGYYAFPGLRPGSYAVYQTQPDHYVDGIDTPGSTSGLPFNLHHFPPETFAIVLDDIMLNLAKDPADDAIVRIPLMAGQSSVENNFSEVLVVRTPVPTAPPPVTPPVFASIVLVTPPEIPISLGPQDMPRAIPEMPLYGSASELRMTWHLSVIDGGMPRGGDGDANMLQGVWRTVSLLDHTQWISVAMNHGYWTMSPAAASAGDVPTDEILFGIAGATPISGDFNGDGISELGLYHEGHWYIDINGNGRWDEEDLWAKLGTVDDLPVVGDWDGDGKDDIGIYGPEWQGDERALQAEPGLPDPQNVSRPSWKQQESTPKNLPPEAAEATDGHRVLKRTAMGSPRADVIDHVFRFGISKDLPVAGDWNGDGIRTVGVFRSGTWYLDVDGDGRQTERDVVVSLGEDGDVPVVGDFNGDGIDELGIYRDGTWLLDTNGNRELDAHDQVFRMGDADSRPVVGDWDGDGRDDPAAYRDAG